MIHFVTTASHEKTVTRLAQSMGWRRCWVWHYENLFRRKRVPTGTWVFTDHERLSAFELSLAANIASQLKQHGAVVLNHPGRVSSRYEMLRRFHREGINRFRPWRCETTPHPALFPVFIRNGFDHRGPRSDLIANQADLEKHLAAMWQKGICLVGQLVIEYAGEQIAAGVWERYSTYCVGRDIIAHHKGIDRHWIVKDGIGAEQLEPPIWERFVESERDFIHGNQYEELLRRAFSLAGIEYGRADFAIVDGKPQIYEINTNPTHLPWERLVRETHPDRRENQLCSERKLREAIQGIDSPASERITLKHRMLKPRFRRRLWGGHALWRP